MERCMLCGRKISNTKYNFGIGCLKKTCLSMHIDDIKNLNGEAELNRKIMYLCNKKRLPKAQSSMLTNRYLTLKILNEVPLEEYDNYKSLLQQDIDKIEKSTKVEELESFKQISLKQANEISKQYKKHQNFFEKMINGDYDVLQNLSFDVVRFSFSKYYSNKPYLNETTQRSQYFIWKSLAMSFKTIGFTFSGKCLENSLKRNPKDIEIISGKVINDIKKDDNFKNKINKILKEHENEAKFNVKEIIRFGDGDLLLALHDATLNVIGERQIDDSWNLQIEITDKYDFTDYKEIQEIIGGNASLLERLGNIANNIAMISTSCNVIREYNIDIKFNLDNWKV